MLYHPSFSQLADRFGEVIAWHCLTEIERASGMRPQWQIADPEMRLANALRAQDAARSSDIHNAAKGEYQWTALTMAKTQLMKVNFFQFILLLSTSLTQIISAKKL